MSGIQQARSEGRGRASLAQGRETPFRSHPPLLQPPPGLLLKEAVAHRIVPHLLHLHPPLLQPQPPGLAPIDSVDIEALAQQAVRGDATLMLASLEALVEAGTSTEMLCLDVLAPAARHLGEMWERDEYDFVEVTVGVARLHQALRRFSRVPPPEPATQRRARSILMVPVPGEQHQFGLAMAADFFRRAGWAVTTGMSPKLDALRSLVRTRHFDVVGFSASAERCAEMLARSLQAVRQSSKNTRVLTMVGGPLFATTPDLAVQLGADACAIDGAQAPAQAVHLLDYADQLTARDGQPGRPASRMAPGEPGQRDRRASPSAAGSWARQSRSSHHQEDRAGGG